MRSPFIDHLCPSKDLHIENLSKSYIYQKNFDESCVSSVKCNTIISNTSNLSRINNLKAKSQRRMNSQNTYQRNLYQNQ